MLLLLLLNYMLVVLSSFLSGGFIFSYVLFFLLSSSYPSFLYFIVMYVFYLFSLLFRMFEGRGRDILWMESGIVNGLFIFYRDRDKRVFLVIMLMFLARVYHGVLCDG